MLFALAAYVIMAGHSLLVVRLLADTPAPHPISTTFRAAGTAWRQTLKNPAALVSIGLLTALIGAAGKVFATANDIVAEKLELGGAHGPGEWVLFALTLVVGAALLEALGRWSQDHSAALPAEDSSYSVVQKITGEELPAFLGWLRRSAVRILELTGVMFVVYFLAYILVKLYYLLTLKLNDDVALDTDHWLLYTDNKSYILWFVASAALVLFLKSKWSPDNTKTDSQKGAA